MIAAALLAENYPVAWYNKGSNRGVGEDFLAVTPILQSMVTGHPVKKVGEEADAGAGGKSRAPRYNQAQDEVTNESLEDTNQQSHLLKASLKSSEMDHRALETAAAELNLNELANKVELNCNDHSGQTYTYESNHHRSSFLDMLAGRSHSTSVSILASMLFAAILECDALDDVVLETLGVMPSSESSPYETAIADFLQHHLCIQKLDGHALFAKEIATALKYMSSLGIMFLEVSYNLSTCCF
jgi:hypothetical protein